MNTLSQRGVTNASLNTGLASESMWSDAQLTMSQRKGITSSNIWAKLINSLKHSISRILHNVFCAKKAHGFRRGVFLDWLPSS
jgi:hypothetical protein